MRFFLWKSVLLLLFFGNGLAQFPSAGQAESRQEFDEYLVILSKTFPEEVISAAGKFEGHWPHSKLLGPVFELQLEAYRSLGDSVKAGVAGEKALQAAPDNLLVLTNLGYIIANSSNDRQELARAEQYARRALELSRTIRISKRISLKEWDDIQGRQCSTAHATLGLAAYKRGDIARAIREFQAAIKRAPAPEPAHYYRLGLLYRSSGNEPGAIEMLERAAECDDAVIRPLAQRELNSMRSRRRPD